MWWARKEGGVKEEWEEQVLIRVGELGEQVRPKLVMIISYAAIKF